MTITTDDDLVARLAARDHVDDLLAGIKFWRDNKIANAELTTADEMLLRWVECSEANWKEVDVG